MPSLLQTTNQKDSEWFSQVRFSGNNYLQDTDIFRLRFPASIFPLLSNLNNFELHILFYSRHLWVENANGGADIIRSCFPGTHEVETKNFYSSSTFTTDFFFLLEMHIRMKNSPLRHQLNVTELREKVTLRK